MKDAFNERLNDIKAPDALVQATLTRMLEENSRMQDTDEQPMEGNTLDLEPDKRRETRKVNWRRASGWALPFAACICFLFVGFHLINRIDSVYWMQLELAQIPSIDKPYRGETDISPRIEEYEQELGLELDTLVDAYKRERTTISYIALPQLQEQGYLVEIAYFSTHNKMTLSIYPFSHPLEVALIQNGRSEKIEGAAVYFGYDKMMDMRVAVWQIGELHFALEAEAMSKSTFETIVRQIATNITERLK